MLRLSKVVSISEVLFQLAREKDYCMNNDNVWMTLSLFNMAAQMSLKQKYFVYLDIKRVRFKIFINECCRGRKKKTSG